MTNRLGRRRERPLASLPGRNASLVSEKECGADSSDPCRLVRPVKESWGGVPRRNFFTRQTSWRGPPVGFGSRCEDSFTCHTRSLLKKGIASMRKSLFAVEIVHVKYRLKFASTDFFSRLLRRRGKGVLRRVFLGGW